jgi:hypothetical protein
MYGVRPALIAILAIQGFMLLIGGASASIVSDIPVQMNNSLFDGGNLYACKVLLTAAIMMSAGLALAVLKLPPAGMFIVLLGVLGALTAIGWADVSIMIVAILITVAMFGSTVVQWVTGSKAGG